LGLPRALTPFLERKIIPILGRNFVAVCGAAGTRVTNKGVIWERAPIAAGEKLRHASFKGLREKAEAATICRLG
jgi:hypothetical protein